MATYQPSSPCSDFCYMDNTRGICLGCFRTVYDIKHWTSYNDEARVKSIYQALQRWEEFVAINQQFFTRENLYYDA